MTQEIDQLLANCLKLHPRVIDLSLDRLYGLLAKLGNPHLSLPPVIHIAGTNGKGSTQAMLGSILRAAGYSVDSYISPHLVRFNERIQLNGHDISDAHLAQVLTYCQQVNQGGEITFFEMTTACAFHVFAQSNAEILILETGLGGRLDATNVVADPLLNVITPISIDHQAFLGTQISDIASEKAGIFKKGTEVVSAPQIEEVAQILQQKADALSIPLWLGQRDWQWETDSEGHYNIGRGTEASRFPKPSLTGTHQIDNAALALMALDRLSERFPVSQIAIDQGLSGVIWPARFQKLTQGALFEHLHPDISVWLDGGHNPAAGHILAQALADQQVDPKSLYVVINMIDTKDAKGFLQPLFPFIKALSVWQYETEHQLQSGQIFQEICEAAAIQFDGTCSDWDQLRQKWPLWGSQQVATDHSGNLLICGSLYLAGHILKTHGS